MAPYHLYFHAPCFDGIVSAVLLHEFLSHQERHDIVLHTVNYHLNATWAAGTLEGPAAVVDFLYHPDAQIWFDHHRTSFEPAELKHDYLQRQDPLVVYEPAYPSCSLLIWERLNQSGLLNRHAENVHVADRIDSARYASPEEAVFSDAPAMRINASLAIGEPEELEEYSKRLVRELLDHDLQDVADSVEVAERFGRFKNLRDLGFQRFGDPKDPDYARLTSDGIFVFHVDGSDALISRYAPFTVAPRALYSVGLVRTSSGSKITAMRNPWLDFESIPLGDIFFQVFSGKGGGHQRVASTRLGQVDHETGEEHLQRVLEAMRQAIAVQQAGLGLLFQAH